MLESFAFVALAVPAAVLSVGVLRLMALVESGLAVHPARERKLTSASRADAHAPRRGALGDRRDAARHEPVRRPDDDPRGASMRVVIVEDNALLNEGIVALLRERSIDVVAQAEDAPGLLRIVAGHKPNVAIVDVRLPPTFTDDGVRAAIEARARFLDLGVLNLSQYVKPVYTQELLASGTGGVGYLLKERVGEVRAFVEAIERVAAGGTDLIARSSPSSCARASTRVARKAPSRASRRASARCSR